MTLSRNDYSPQPIGRCGCYGAGKCAIVACICICHHENNVATGVKFNPSPAPEAMGTDATKKTDQIIRLIGEALKMRGMPRTAADLSLLRFAIFDIISAPQPDPWVDVKVGLPKEDQKVLICYGAGPWITAAQFSTDMGGKPEFGFLGTRPGNGYAWDVTHWRELPAPPDQVGKLTDEISKQGKSAPPETRATEGK